MTEILGTIYSNMSEDFQSGILPISRCLKAGNHDTTVVYKVGQTESDNPVTWGGLQEHQTPRSDGVSPTLTAAMGMGGGQTPIFTERNDSVGKVGQISSEGSQCGSVFSDDGNMGTLTAGTHGNGNPHICTQYRIRKLTPRECWRLMSFTDEDFDKAAAVNSNTQLYKQAGNSIVKNVLMAIFGQMIPGKENVYKEGMVEHGEEKKL